MSIATPRPPAMSEPLTAAGAYLVRDLTREPGVYSDETARRLVSGVEAEAATRAVDEALSVVSDLRSVLVSEHGHDSDGPAPWPACLPVHIALNRAAALVAHLRGPRPEGEG